MSYDENEPKVEEDILNEEDLEGYSTCVTIMRHNCYYDCLWEKVIYSCAS